MIERNQETTPVLVQSVGEDTPPGDDSAKIKNEDGRGNDVR